MSTPAPHTPVNFLKAGTGMAFSAQCVALLAEAGYQPEDFGSHSYVQKRLAQARAAVAQWEAAKAGGPPAAEPSEHQKFLATCQSGHLAQDAIHREGGSENRGNNCANRVDGYNESDAPCMPHQGSAQDAGTQHNLVSNMETSQPRDRGLSTGQSYNPEHADADADARCRATLDHVDRPDQPTTQGQASGGGASTSSATAGQAGQAGAAAPGSVGPVDPNNPGEITGETAADCINAFRKHATQAMKQNCADSVEENRATANGGAGRTAAQGAQHRRRLRKRAASTRAREQEAAQELETANRSRGQHERYVRETRETLASTSDPAERARLRQQLRERQGSLSAAEERCERAAAAHGEASQAAATAQGASTRAQNALCAAQQGERLRAGRGRDDPRCPGVNPIPPVTG